jgi:hypothetical protein
LEPTRQHRKTLERENQKWPEQLTRVPESQWPSKPERLVEVWRSRRFFVQIYAEDNGIERITVSRIDTVGDNWLDDVSWNDLQRLKTECGRGDKDAVEVFPSDADVVNVSNMRHLWILPETLPFVWRKI